MGRGRLTVTGAIAVALLCAAPLGAFEHQRAAAEARPNFSGQWVLETASAPGPEVPRTLSIRHTERYVNVRGGRMTAPFEHIAIDRELERGTVSESHHIGVIGGTVPGMGKDGRPTGTVTSRAVKWDGNTLLFESESHGHSAADPWTERREAWSFDDAGRLRIVISNRSSDGAASTVTLSYRRR